MKKVGSTRNILLDRSTFMCRALLVLWNTRGKILNLLLTWLSWDLFFDSCISSALRYRFSAGDLIRSEVVWMDESVAA